MFTKRKLNIGEELSEREKQEIRESLIKAFPMVNDFYLEETKAWYPLEEEVRLKFEAGLYDDPIVSEKPSA